MKASLLLFYLYMECRYLQQSFLNWSEEGSELAIEDGRNFDSPAWDGAVFYHARLSGFN
jgi:hypothetical protein